MTTLITTAGGLTHTDERMHRSALMRARRYGKRGRCYMIVSPFIVVSLLSHDEAEAKRRAEVFVKRAKKEKAFVVVARRGARLAQMHVHTIH